MLEYWDAGMKKDAGMRNEIKTGKGQK